MAKKTTKNTVKKTAKKVTSKVAKKSVTKKKTAKKVTQKKVTNKVTKKKVTKKSPVKKITKKKVAPKTTKKGARKTTKKTAASTVKSLKSKAIDQSIHEKPVKKLKLKTPYSKKELEHYLSLLLAKRAEIIGDMSSMSTEALRLSDNSNLSNMPIHMADIGSDNYEQELTLGLVESERKMIVEIDEAIERIVGRTFGVCEVTGKNIPKARLDIKPWAKYTIEIAREMEKQGRYRV